MPVRSLITWISRNESFNFFTTNCIPRRLATRFTGWFSRIEQPLIRDLSIAVWRLFCNIDLSEAKKDKFKSLRDGFIRELKEGARPVDSDPKVLVSPCDAIVGSCGQIEDGDLLQVKGSRYPLEELVRDRELAEFYRDGCYATLRLTAAMYHRFHAPHDGKVERVTHIWGDTWNVNPPTLARVEKVFCRNERAVIRMRVDPTGDLVTLTTVAAILVAGIRLRLSGQVIDPRRAKPEEIPSEVPFCKGEEMGWFEHGSTILVLAPAAFVMSDNVTTGSRIQMGRALMQRR